MNENASEAAKEVWSHFAAKDEFKFDFELTPIHCAALQEYDDLDRIRPSLEDILMFIVDVLCQDATDWKSVKKAVPGPYSLYSEVIGCFRTGQENGKSLRQIFQDLIEQPDSIQKWTPLLWATYAGRTESVKTLLGWGANPLAITPVGRNIFHHAAESGNQELLEYLFAQDLDTAVDINLHDKWRETPLHIACSKSSVLVPLLINHGAELEVRQYSGETPFHYLRHLNGSERIPVLKTLLSQVRPGSPLINAVNAAGHPCLFHLLGSPPCVKMLLEWDADTTIVDLSGQNVLHHACIHNYHESLVMLLDSRASQLVAALDSSWNTPLFAAFQNRAMDCIEILLRLQYHHPGVTDRAGWTILHYATRLNDESILNLVLSTPKLRKKAKTNNGQTALDIARAYGCSPWIKEILAKAI